MVARITCAWILLLVLIYYINNTFAVVAVKTYGNEKHFERNTYCGKYTVVFISEKNPCYNATEVDCDPNAFCENLHKHRFNCTCNEGFIDKSPDIHKPGRLCVQREDHAEQIFITCVK